MQAGALFAGLLMVDSPFAKKAHACMQPLTSLFGGMYLGSLGMIVNPVRERDRERERNRERKREIERETEAFRKRRACAVALERCPRGSIVCMVFERVSSPHFFLPLFSFCSLPIFVFFVAAVGMVVFLFLFLLLLFLFF